MSILKDLQDKKRAVNNLVTHLKQRTCPHCLKEYTLGKDGVQNGCDECEGIVRNPLDGTVINFGDITEETFDQGAA